MLNDLGLRINVYVENETKRENLLPAEHQARWPEAEVVKGFAYFVTDKAKVEHVVAALELPDLTDLTIWDDDAQKEVACNHFGIELEDVIGFERKECYLVRSDECAMWFGGYETIEEAVDDLEELAKLG